MHLSSDNPSNTLSIRLHLVEPHMNLNTHHVFPEALNTERLHPADFLARLRLLKNLANALHRVRVQCVVASAPSSVYPFLANCGSPNIDSENNIAEGRIIV